MAARRPPEVSPASAMRASVSLGAIGLESGGLLLPLQGDLRQAFHENAQPLVDGTQHGAGIGNRLRKALQASWRRPVMGGLQPGGGLVPDGQEHHWVTGLGDHLTQGTAGLELLANATPRLLLTRDRGGVDSRAWAVLLNECADGRNVLTDLRLDLVDLLGERGPCLRPELRPVLAQAHGTESLVLRAWRPRSAPSKVAPQCLQFACVLLGALRASPAFSLLCRVTSCLRSSSCRCRYG